MKTDMIKLAMTVGCLCEEAKRCISEKNPQKFMTHIVSGIVIDDITTNVIEFKGFKDLCAIMIGVEGGIVDSEKALKLIESVQVPVSMMMAFAADAIDLDPESESLVNIDKITPIFDASIKEAKEKRNATIIKELLKNPIRVDGDEEKE